MRKHIISLFALLSMMAVSCQKESFTETEPATVGEPAVYSLSYTVDGTTHRATFQSNAERLAFIRQLVALTREGTASLSAVATQPPSMLPKRK